LPPKEYSLLLRLRQRVLWPESALSEVALPSDASAHLALLDCDGDLLGALSLFLDPAPADSTTTADAAAASAVEKVVADASASASAASDEDVSKPSVQRNLIGQSVQLRKFAVEGWAQGQGLGTLLLAEV